MSVQHEVFRETILHEEQTVSKNTPLQSFYPSGGDLAYIIFNTSYCTPARLSEPGQTDALLIGATAMQLVGNACLLSEEHRLQRLFMSSLKTCLHVALRSICR